MRFESKEAAETALREWAATNARRDQMVTSARRVGVSKNRIHTLTGIARTTIDRILEDAMTETTIPEHFTAWLTTDTSALAGDNADVVVLADELRGEPDDPNAWSSTTDERFSAVTTVNAAEGDIEDAIREANDLLAAAGWSRVGEWESVTTGCIVTVERA